MVNTSNLSNFTIAPDSAAPAITFGNFTGQNVPNSVAITYTYSMNKQGCTNNPSPDFTLEVKDPVSLQPLQNFNVPISVVYSKSTFGNIQCTETGCQATTDSNGNTVCACSDISVFGVKDQLARIYQNSELRYLTINNLLDALSHPPYTKWSFWVIIGYSIWLLLTWIIVRTVNKNYCIIKKTKERRRREKNNTSNFCCNVGILFIIAHPLIGIYVYKDQAISKSFRALLYYQRSMLILAYSAIFTSDSTYQMVSIISCKFILDESIYLSL
jgi:hypothetical protein